MWCGFLCWQTVYTDLFVYIERLVVGEATVKTHVGRVLQKLDARERVQAVIVAYRSGIAFGS